MSRQKRFLAVASVTLLVFDAGAAYQVGVRARRAPSFRRGGRFLSAAGAEPGASPAPALGDGATTTTALPVVTAGSPLATNATSSTRTRSSSVPAAASAPAPGTTSRGPATAGTRLPATGTYTWDVSGTEAASGFGSRSFPDTMKMVAHRDPGLGAHEVVLDSTYSSNHSEREIIGVENNGIFFDFEGGQVRFGPSAQTNQGDYKPPMLQVPFPLAGGVVRTGTTTVVASDGSTQRVENWTVKILGQETIHAAGGPVSTWKISVDRKGSGGNQKVDRSRTLWFDPVRQLWVKYTETMHGEQSYGVTFTYDENLTATLRSFAAG
jgi:hypothetical protein